uniref:Uncharacterized protein n=1 Tax=Timema shepardi TaxID=629360 RepID=A0A7R9B9M6_TIMSH|nr:unnamed protein product [Timema shepardi]
MKVHLEHTPIGLSRAKDRPTRTSWNFHLKRWWAYFKLYSLSQSDHCVSEDQDQLLPSKEEERMEAPKKLNREEWVEDLDVDIEHLSTNFHNIDVSCQKVRGHYPPQQKYTKIGWYRPSTCEDVGIRHGSEEYGSYVPAFTWSEGEYQLTRARFELTTSHIITR